MGGRARREREKSNMRHGIKMAVVLMAIALVASACGTSGDDAESTATTAESTATTVEAPPATEPPAAATRVALVMSGSINDGGWNQGAYAGLDALKADGYDVAFTENVAQADIPSTVEGYALDGFDLVIGHGFEFGTTVSELAPEYAETQFFATTFTPDAGATLPSNLAFVDPQYYPISFAAGALAALTSDSGIVGIVGGGDNPTQRAMIEAFKGGVVYADPAAKALDVLTGNYDDPQLGREAATAMIGQGADVILHIANTTGIGAIEASTEAGVTVIGFYQDQTAVAPDEMATSFEIELAAMVQFLGASVADGTFPGGTEWAPSTEFMWTARYGDADYNDSIIGAELWDEWQAIFDGVNTGDIDVPTGS